MLAGVGARARSPGCTEHGSSERASSTASRPQGLRRDPAQLAAIRGAPRRPS